MHAGATGDIVLSFDCIPCILGSVWLLPPFQIFFFIAIKIVNLIKSIVSINLRREVKRFVQKDLYGNIVDCKSRPMLDLDKYTHNLHEQGA